MAEERVKPRSIFVEEAIQLALESRWQEALAVNQALIERHGPDEDTYNRIGKALTELGRLDEALEAYRSALQLNPLNLIAQKNVRKLSAIVESKETLAGAKQAINVDVFAEEPGKTALTVLKPPAQTVTVKVAPGDTVLINAGEPSAMLAEEITALRDLTVVTNALEVMERLTGKSGLKVILTVPRECRAIGPRARASSESSGFANDFR